LHLKQ
jgi:hypothetical protein